MKHRENVYDATTAAHQTTGDILRALEATLGTDPSPQDVAILALRLAPLVLGSAQALHAGTLQALLAGSDEQRSAIAATIEGFRRAKRTLGLSDACLEARLYNLECYQDRAKEEDEELFLLREERQRRRSKDPKARPCTPGQPCTADVPCLAHVASVSERLLDSPEAKAADLAEIPGEIDMAGQDEEFALPYAGELQSNEDRAWGHEHLTGRPK